jgi:hypothetical protein
LSGRGYVEPDTHFDLFASGPQSEARGHSLPGLTAHFRRVSERARLRADGDGRGVVAQTSGENRGPKSFARGCDRWQRSVVERLSPHGRRMARSDPDAGERYPKWYPAGCNALLRRSHGCSVPEAVPKRGKPRKSKGESQVASGLALLCLHPCLDPVLTPFRHWK